MFGPLFKKLKKDRVLFKKFGLIVLSVLFVFSFSFGGILSTDLYKANSLVNVKHAPFDGLVYPYAYGVDWVAMSGMGVDRLVAYNEVPLSVKVDPLIYNARELAIPMESLGFTRSEDIKVRNAKITYTVPYMGTYKLDGIEGKGSHAAVDIALPTGTPVVAIGNGVVIKVETQDWGFGKHIVLRHNEFPDINDSNRLTTYFSSYSHLDSMSVNVGDVVRKGQLIGTIGISGTATTPHLHFQIDKDSAPWSPYWPFTATEARDAGLDFYDGVNEGLGKANGYEHTINPMTYVQKYFAAGANAIASSDTSRPSVPTIDNPTVFVPPSGVVRTSTPVFEDSRVLNPDESVTLTSDFEIESPELMVLGNSYSVKLKNYSAGSGMFASISDSEFDFKSNLIANYSVPRVLDFSTGEVNIDFEPKELGNMNFTLSVNGENFHSRNVEVRLFNDVKNSDTDLKSIKFLKDKKIINGYPDGEFKPDNAVNKAEAAKFVVESLPASRKSALGGVNINFTDVSESDWYYEYVKVLAQLGAVDASRTTFEPEKPVNLAEMLKMLYIAMGADVNEIVDAGNSEYFNVNEWYSKYLQLGMSQSVINSNDAMEVSEKLTRRSVARIMHNMLKL